MYLKWNNLSKICSIYKHSILCTAFKIGICNADVMKSEVNGLGKNFDILIIEYLFDRINHNRLLVIDLI